MLLDAEATGRAVSINGALFGPTLQSRSSLRGWEVRKAFEGPPLLERKDPVQTFHLRRKPPIESKCSHHTLLSGDISTMPWVSLVFDYTSALESNVLFRRYRNSSDRVVSEESSENMDNGEQ